MRIMWICGGLLPQACEAIGAKDSRINGGFMGAAFSALVSCEPDSQFCVLSWDVRPCDVTIGNSRHVSFGGRSRSCTSLKVEYCKAAQSIVEEFSPDIIHILGTEGVFSNLPDWVFGGRPVVVSMQGIIAACAIAYSGGLMPAELRGTNFNYSYFRHGTSIFREQAMWSRQRAKTEAEIIRRHSYFIGRTDFDQAWVRYYNPAARYFHVNESMRPEFYNNEKWSPQKVVPHTIFCGGASGYPLKGCHWALKAIAALRKAYPDIQLRIANAEALQSGRSWTRRFRDGAYAMYLRRLIKELGIGSCVAALPTLSAVDVCQELERAELFVLPSLCENSPNALCEARLVGTPTIACYVGGIPSIVKNGQDAILVPPSDPAQLANAIDRCFSSPLVVQQMAERARFEAEKCHDRDQNARALLKVYETIIRESGE